MECLHPSFLGFVHQQEDFRMGWHEQPVVASPTWFPMISADGMLKVQSEE